MTPSYDAQPPRDPRLQQVLDRAAGDPQFRGRLLAEPHAAIRDAFGIEIPGSFRIRFVERDANTDALIVLPNARPRAAQGAPGAQGDGELDDASLEAVAGGWSAGSGEWSTGHHGGGGDGQQSWDGWNNWAT